MLGISKRTPKSSLFSFKEYYHTFPNFSISSPFITVIITVFPINSKQTQNFLIHSY
ncbi:hypothetical protein LEP1GSC199_3480 [Leptospira vanthielii serovar Holland str. Waz Holland = ATCC 700522]|uniref:Uncharacterized protein n=1 Tax=Leptospira vanthielii serovar Holland str. Waz Holland = ATCC 700522 TaxID=1218591 RepID=N1W8Q4_9LEPT|nr:hypothetical protein LEP1GSC199_3480 [Leptospira vanthielii serovar Holland str. Waz Holland = ATCC 700522]